jgi:multiple sugar transport system permease protein
MEGDLEMALTDTHPPFSGVGAPRQKARQSAQRFSAYVMKLIIGLVLFSALAPILWMVVSSFKSKDDIISSPPMFIFTPTWENYARILNMPPILNGLQNSIVVSANALVIGFLLGVPVAYCIARIPFRFNADLRLFVLSLRFMPPIAVAIPFFVMWMRLQMLDKIGALVFTYLLISVSSMIWLTIGVFKQLPIEFEEAAYLDGASQFQVFSRIALPIALPSLLGMAIFVFILIWNEFFLAFLLTSVRAMTMPVASATFAVVGMEVPWGQICASVTLLSIPPLIFSYIFMRFMPAIFEIR